MEGSATLTIVTSSRSMNVARHTATRVHHLAIRPSYEGIRRRDDAGPARATVVPRTRPVPGLASLTVMGLRDLTDGQECTLFGVLRAREDRTGRDGSRYL